MIHFAHISDIHISAQGDKYDMLSGRAAGFVANIVARLNQQDDLDFVLITGDLFNEASPQELHRFQQTIRSLQKPYYVIPGNHDRGGPDSPEGLTRLEFAERFNPQIEARLATTESQLGYWSIALKPDVQLIGLDSIKDDDWGGVIGSTQLAWLENELNICRDRLAIVAVHHPLHRLASIDEHPDWANFVCDNGAAVLALLDRYPQVKLVLTGHHHVTKADRFGPRLHLACPAVAVYPCAYRSLRLSRRSNGGWQLAWQTHPATDQTTVAEARARMANAWIEEAEFEPDFVEAYLEIARGSGQDRAGQLRL